MPEQPPAVTSPGQAMGRGVLRPVQAAQRFTLARHDPSPALAPFLDYHWIVRWDLRGQPDHEQTILPHPNVNLAFEGGPGGPIPPGKEGGPGASIYGVDRKLFTRRLSGKGKALGIRFRPGGFHPFWGAPVSQLTDQVVPATELFGPAAERACELIMEADIADADMVSRAENLLCSVLPERDPAAEQAADLVTLIIADQALRRVDELSAASGLTIRSLQRLFAEYVGVSPKWVMRRSRLHDAAQRADGGDPVDWAQLAADLGYSDQAHLARDFTATLGAPPTRYVS